MEALIIHSLFGPAFSMGLCRLSVAMGNPRIIRGFLMHGPWTTIDNPWMAHHESREYP